MFSMKRAGFPGRTKSIQTHLYIHTSTALWAIIGILQSRPSYSFLHHPAKNIDGFCRAAHPAKNIGAFCRAFHPAKNIDFFCRAAHSKKNIGAFCRASQQQKIGAVFCRKVISYCRARRRKYDLARRTKFTAEPGVGCLGVQYAWALGGQHIQSKHKSIKIYQISKA